MNNLGEDKVFEILMGIQKDVATLVERTHDMDHIEEMAATAEKKAKENSSRINKLEERLQWSFRTAVGAIIIAAFISQ